MLNLTIILTLLLIISVNSHLRSIIQNKRWVDENLISMNNEEIKNVESYVREIHPYSEVDNFKDFSLVKMSTYADAVTVFCYEKIGNSFNLNDIFKYDENYNYSKTSIANIAYISIYHSDSSVRKKGKLFISNYRRQLTNKENLLKNPVFIVVIVVIGLFALYVFFCNICSSYPLSL